MISIVIPVRLESSRFPNKVIQPINGKTLLQHLLDKLTTLSDIHDITIITDSAHIQELFQSEHCNVIYSKQACSCGTERIAHQLNKIQNEHILNIQADEGLSTFTFLPHFIKTWKQHQTNVCTAIYKLESTEQLQDPNIVKVVKNKHDKAIYFSRQAIPFFRDNAINTWTHNHQYWGHMGLYAYTKTLLSDYLKHGPCPLENIEKLEQLRFIDMNTSIHTVEIPSTHARAIDTPEDIKKATQRS